MNRASDRQESTRVALLRGVNVGGVRMRMVDACAHLKNAGLNGCEAVLASGNLVFRSRLSSSDAQTLIENVLSEGYSYPALAVILDAPEIAEHLAAAPFEQTDERHSYVVFASEAAVLAEAVSRATDSAAGSDVDEVAAGKGALYWSVTKGHSTTSPVAKALARSFGARSFAGARKQQGAARPGYVTTRGVTTLQKILAKCGAL